MDSLTTVKHQSSQPLLKRSSKAEENNNTSVVEQQAFIKTDGGKQRLFPLFSLSPTICVFILDFYSPIPLCINKF